MPCKIRVVDIGGSLYINIPKPIASMLNLKKDSIMSLNVQPNQLVYVDIHETKKEEQSTTDDVLSTDDDKDMTTEEKKELDAIMTKFDKKKKR
jgi:antitoxin component of MazEF toxin-antitoxin module